MLLFSGVVIDGRFAQNCRKIICRNKELLATTVCIQHILLHPFHIISKSMNIRQRKEQNLSNMIGTIVRQQAKVGVDSGTKQSR